MFFVDERIEFKLNSKLSNSFVDFIFSN